MKRFILTFLVSLFFLSGTWVEAADPNKDLILYFPFDEGKGNVTKDASPNKFSGDINNAKWVEGIKGDGLVFDDGSVEVDKPLGIELEAFTIEIWFKPDKVIDGGNRIDLVYRFGDCGRPHLTFNRGGFLFGFYAAAAGANVDVHSQVEAWEPRWYYMVATQDPDKAVLYVDGVVDNELKTGGQAVFDYGEFGVTIADGACADNNNFKGTVDEVRIWSVALTEAEVEQSMEDTLAVEARGKLATTWGNIKNFVR